MPRARASSAVQKKRKLVGELALPEETAVTRKAKQDSDFSAEFRSADDVLAQLVWEVVQGRIRHRALLKTLSDGDFDWSKYTGYIEQVEASDGEALFRLVVMKWEAFSARYSEWMKSDFSYFGFKRRRANQDDDLETSAS